MWDFVESEDISNISREIYENGGIISAVCHSVGALLNLKAANGTDLIKGKKITGYSRTEEKLAGVLEKIPFILEEELKNEGDSYKKSLIPFSSYVLTGERIITGQNPQSTNELAKELLKSLV